MGSMTKNGAENNSEIILLFRKMPSECKKAISTSLALVEKMLRKLKLDAKYVNEKI